MRKVIFTLLVITALFTLVNGCSEVAADVANEITDTYVDSNTDDGDIISTDSNTDINCASGQTCTDIDEINSSEKQPDNESGYTPYEEYRPPFEEPPCECSELSDEEREQLRVWTVEELGEIIAASGTFWNDWWYLTGWFDYEHFERRAFDERIPEHLSNSGPWEIFSPTAQFTSLAGIRDFLVQYYTTTRVDEFFSHRAFPFVEHENIVYVNTARTCTYRPPWERATHTLIKQNGCRIIVESTMGVWTISFTFINGRIHNESEAWYSIFG